MRASGVSDLSQATFEQFCVAAGLSADVSVSETGVRKAVDIARGHSKSPCAVEIPECLVEHLGPPVEGACFAMGDVSVFEPSDGRPEYWASGAEGRLRYPGGSVRILVIGDAPDGLLFTRAPLRRERRKHERTPAEGIALVRLGDKSGSLELSDLSAGGIGLEGTYPVEVGQTLSILLRLEGKESLALECEGIIRSCRTMSRVGGAIRKVGIEFTSVSDALLAEICDRASHPAE
ncbi:MAG: PilZ domain-containing protein [Fimbriimonadales bacterium]